MTNFHVGQMVVCIDDEGLHRPDPRAPNSPHQGCVYTIREIGVWNGEVGLLLEEVVNPRCEGWRDPRTANPLPCPSLAVLAKPHFARASEGRGVV
jgi:hypothetical protein